MLADQLTQLRDFLGRHGEGRLAGAISTVLASGADDEVALLRGARGLCPALERLVLSSMNGHGVQVCAIDGTNRKLAALRSALCAATDSAV